MRNFLVIILVFTCAQSNAQVNLVMNPSLEQYSNCPNNNDEIKYANYWQSLDSSWNPPDWSHDLNGVPEYCNSCAGPYSPYGVPSFINYYQYPRTGDGMAQVQMFYDEVDPTYTYKRDYLQGHLSNTLIAGKSYCVTFYVVLNNGSTYAINQIGAYLDNGTVDTTHQPDLPQTIYTPQILETAIISDTLKWVKVQGSFIAVGNERLITIANFFDKAHTTFIPAPGVDTTGIYAGGVGRVSWYLIDDVSVIEMETKAYAGGNKHISAGDSVLIGTNDGYLPTYWFANGNLIDSNTAGFYVRPTITTSYVMSLDVCRTITYDTITVFVGPLGLSNIQSGRFNVKIYPNPVNDELNITGIEQHTTFRLRNVTGICLLQGSFEIGNNMVSISNLPQGIYILEMTGADGQGNIIRVIKK
jgi:hypothetical protein